MRTYPRNSPEACARILALAMLADGHLCKSELDVIEQHRAHEQLGLSRAQWHEVLHGFCEDLLSTAQLSWADVCRIDADTLSALLAEVDDPQRRRTLMQLCVQVVEADRHMADGEALLLVEAFRQWGLDRDTLAEPVPV